MIFLLLLGIHNAHVDLFNDLLLLGLGTVGIDGQRIANDDVRSRDAIVVHVVVIAGHNRSGQRYGPRIEARFGPVRRFVKLEPR